jgi:hypothetical protein
MNTSVSLVSEYVYKAAVFVFWPVFAVIVLTAGAAILVVAWPLIWSAHVRRNASGNLEIRFADPNGSTNALKGVK